MKKKVISFICFLFFAMVLCSCANSGGSKKIDSPKAKELREESVKDMKKDLRDDMDAADGW